MKSAIIIDFAAYLKQRDFPHTESPVICSDELNTAIQELIQRLRMANYTTSLN